MSRKEPGFAERLQTAAKAKQAPLEKIRATAPANDPQSAERQAARMETARAHKIRTAERKHANRVAAERRSSVPAGLLASRRPQKVGGRRDRPSWRASWRLFSLRFHEDAAPPIKSSVLPGRPRQKLLLRKSYFLCD